MLRTLALMLAAVIGFGTAAVAAPASAPAPLAAERLTAASGVTDVQWRRDRHHRWDRRHERRDWRRHHRRPPVACENVRVRFFDGYRWRVRVERQCYPRRWR